MEIYVLQVITGKEQQALKVLEPLLKSGERIIYPRRELIQRKKGRRYKKVQPLFPGYLFWESSDLSDGVVHQALRLPNTIQFLPGNSNILSISPEDREILKPFLRFNGLTSLVNLRFNENDRVVILDGPLKGQEGCIVKIDKRRRRMRVMLNLYRTGHLIDFGYRDLGTPK